MRSGCCHGDYAVLRTCPLCFRGRNRNFRQEIVASFCGVKYLGSFLHLGKRSSQGSGFHGVFTTYSSCFHIALCCCCHCCCFIIIIILLLHTITYDMTVERDLDVLSHRDLEIGMTSALERWLPQDSPFSTDRGCREEVMLLLSSSDNISRYDYANIVLSVITVVSVTTLRCM